MLTITTILHPTDFSARCEAAFHLAQALARDHGAQIVLLHVITPTPELMPTSGIVAPPTEGFRKEMHEELEKVRLSDTRIPMDYRIEEGDAVNKILRVAEECGADMIVMGTHGRTGVQRFLMGSVAESVLREARCPVVTMKSPFPEAEKAN